MESGTEGQQRTIEFLPYEHEDEPLVSVVQREGVPQSGESDPEQLEKLKGMKNAFRYSTAHSGTVVLIRYISRYMLKHSSLERLRRESELITGERYFFRLIAELSHADRVLALREMLQFCSQKYLRLLARPGKGKRTAMDKALYLRFKN